MMTSATGQAEVMRSVDDSQGYALSMGDWIRQKQIQMEANGQTEGKTPSDDDDIMGHRSPFCIYCVMSSSECEGSCLGV